jgi:hypothetical protein
MSLLYTDFVRNANTCSGTDAPLFYYTLLHNARRIIEPPFLNCLICWLGPILALATGALYVHFAASEGAQIDVGEGALGGALTGAIANAANSLVSGILNVIFGTVQTASGLLGGEGGSAVLAAGATAGGVLVGIIMAAVIGAITGAIGGVIYAAIKSK